MLETPVRPATAHSQLTSSGTIAPTARETPSTQALVWANE